MFFRFLRKLAEMLRGDSRRSVVQGFLRPIDTDSIARRLQLNDAAKRQAKNELPTTQTQSLDWVEQRIVQEVESEWAWQGDQFINQLRAYAVRLRAHSIGAEHTKLRLDAENALTKLRNASTRAVVDLGPLQSAYLAAQKDLDTFRKRHGLERPARSPTTRWTTFGLMTIIVGFESVLNGFFFAKASEFGLIGGIGTAVGISIVNVSVAFLLGLVPARWLNHRRILVNVIGLAVTSAGWATLTGLHLFAAHFREASAQIGDERAFSLALKTTMNNPITFSDLNSLYLFALGMAFALAAFYKGYTFEDPYPGYGPVSRRAAEANRIYSNEHAELFDELEDIKEGTLQSLKDGIDRIPKAPENVAHICAHRSALIQQFKTYESSVETAANQLLALYRDANRVARKTRSPPHFDQRWRLPHSVVDNPEVKAISSAEQPHGSNINSVLDELRRLASAILSEYERLRDQYPHPTKMTSRDA
jgi:hypothetical protein